MKKLITLALISCALNAYEINFSKSFEQNVKADTLTTNISVSVEKEDEKKVNFALDKFNRFFKESKIVELKNGSYSISPNYKYLKNETKFIGYEGRINYKVKSSDAKNMNTFISNLLEEKDGLNGIKIRISYVTWEVSKKTRKQTIENLRLKSILWANDYTKDLGKKLKTNCSLKKVTIDAPQRYYERATNMYASKSASNVVPAKTQQDINIHPNFTIECD